MEKTLVVTKHSKTRTKDKEPIYLVTLKTPPTKEPTVKVDIKATLKALFEQFPLNEQVVVAFTQPQSKLLEEEAE